MGRKARSRAAATGAHSPADAARTLGLSPKRVRALVDAGFVGRRTDDDGEDGVRLTFPDLALLRTVKRLVDAGLPFPRVQRALRGVRAQLVGVPLHTVNLVPQDGRVLVQREDSAWDAETGQRLLAFTPQPIQRRVVAFRPRRDTVPDIEPPSDDDLRDLDADAWFDEACDLEEIDPEAAEDAYRKTLTIDPSHSDALLNLGRLVHERGDLSAAEGFYRRALRLDAHDAIAAFNLGVALQDLERYDEAGEAYLQAIEHDPECADAYYNVAGIFQEQGDEVSALRYLKMYRNLVRG